MESELTKAAREYHEAQERLREVVKREFPIGSYWYITLPRKPVKCRVVSHQFTKDGEFALRLDTANGGKTTRSYRLLYRTEDLSGADA